MKIQFDTSAKIIKVEGTVDLGELVNALEKFLPNGAWREYKLETNTVIYWQQPYVYRWDTYPYWQNPIYSTITAPSTCQDFPNTTTIYTVDIN